MKTVRPALIILWLSALAMLLFMLYKWHNTDTTISGKRNVKSTKDLLIDEMLLLPGELKLESSSPLININLNNQVINDNDAEKLKVPVTVVNSKAVYDKILEEKLKKATTTPPPSEDFSIKPLPK